MHTGEMQRFRAKAIGDCHPQRRPTERQVNNLAQGRVAKIVAWQGISGLDQLLRRRPGANPMSLGVKRTKSYGSNRGRCEQSTKGYATLPGDHDHSLSRDPLVRGVPYCGLVVEVRVVRQVAADGRVVTEFLVLHDLVACANRAEEVGLVIN